MWYRYHPVHIFCFWRKKAKTVKYTNHQTTLKIPNIPKKTTSEVQAAKYSQKSASFQPCNPPTRALARDWRVDREILCRAAPKREKINGKILGFYANFMGFYGDLMVLNGDFMGFYGDFMVLNGDFMGFYGDLMGFYGVLMVLNGDYIIFM